MALNYFNGLINLEVTMNIRFLQFDTSIMQTRTVSNICRVLKHAYNTQDLEVIMTAIVHILDQERIAAGKREKRTKNKGITKRTTVSSRISQLKSN